MGKGYYEAIGGCPPHPCWVINYDAERALHNLKFLAGVSAATVRIYVSRECGAIVVSNMALECIREPHVMAWRQSFYEIDESTLRRRMEEQADGLRQTIGEEPGSYGLAKAG